jgi:DegV family protein with EDD domain
MGQVKIVTDSTADLSKELIEAYDIRIVPTTISFEMKAYKDVVELTAEEFYQKLPQSARLPVTSPPSRKEFSTVYTELSQLTDTIISIHLSSKLSKTYELATSMAKFCMDAAKKQGKELTIEVVDSWMTSIGLGMIVIEAARLATAGKSKEEVLERVLVIIPQIKNLFIVDTMEYLQKSGRIGRAAAFIGGLLNRKPIFTIEQGEAAGKGTVGGGKLLDRIIEFMSQEIPAGSKINLGIAHAMAEEKAHALQKQIETQFDCVEVYTSVMSSSVGATVGPGSLGVVYYPAQ